MNHRNTLEAKEIAGTEINRSEEKVNSVGLQPLPVDLFQKIPRFLPVKEICTLKFCNHLIKDQVNSSLPFLCQQHPQWTETSSLSKYLITKAAENTHLSEPQCLALMNDYFNEPFGEIAVNLTTHYSEFCDRALDSLKTQKAAIKGRFYPSLTQTWVIEESKRLNELARKIVLGIEAIVKNEPQIAGLAGESAPSILTILSADFLKLEPQLPLRVYHHLINFFEKTAFLESLWTDLTLANMASVYSEQGKELNRRIIAFFSNPQRTKNLSSNGLIYICGLWNLDKELLITNDKLFYHFNRLSPEELVFAVKNMGAAGEDQLNFIKVVIAHSEIQQRLSSHHYVELTKYPDYISSSTSIVILSIPTIIGKLKDDDFLFLLSELRTDKETPQLLKNYPYLKERMTNSNPPLWFKFAKKSGLHAEMVAKDPDIYRLFSSAQLKYLIFEHREISLLKDDYVIGKLQDILTPSEIANLKLKVKVQEENERITQEEKIKITEKIDCLRSCEEEKTQTYYYPPDPRVVQLCWKERDREREAHLNHRMSTSNNPPASFAEEKSRNIPSPRNDQSAEKIQYAVNAATILLIAGTGTGVATIFYPYLLPAAIALLGSALVVYGACALAKYHLNQHGIFSPASPAVQQSTSDNSVKNDRFTMNHRNS